MQQVLLAVEGVGGRPAPRRWFSLAAPVPGEVRFEDALTTCQPGQPTLQIRQVRCRQRGADRRQVARLRCRGRVGAEAQERRHDRAHCPSRQLDSQFEYRLADTGSRLLESLREDERGELAKVCSRTQGRCVTAMSQRDRAVDHLPSAEPFLERVADILLHGQLEVGGGFVDVQRDRADVGCEIELDARAGRSRVDAEPDARQEGIGVMAELLDRQARSKDPLDADRRRIAKRHIDPDVRQCGLDRPPVELRRRARWTARRAGRPGGH